MRATVVASLGLAVALISAPAHAMPEPVRGTDPAGDTLSGYSSMDITSTTKKLRRTDDGTVWLALTIRYAMPVGGGLLGGLVGLDTDGDGARDARLEFLHWDNGLPADTCDLVRDGDRTQEHAQATGADFEPGHRFTCRLPKAHLEATARVRWWVLSRVGAYGNVREDRAPDVGWFR